MLTQYPLHVPNLSLRKGDVSENSLSVWLGSGTPAPETVSHQHSLIKNMSVLQEHLWRVLVSSGKPLFFNTEARQTSSHPSVAPNDSHSSFQNYLRTIQWVSPFVKSDFDLYAVVRNRVMKCGWTRFLRKEPGSMFPSAKEPTHWGSHQERRKLEAIEFSSGEVFKSQEGRVRKTDFLIKRIFESLMSEVWKHPILAIERRWGSFETGSDSFP